MKNKRYIAWALCAALLCPLCAPMTYALPQAESQAPRADTAEGTPLPATPITPPAIVSGASTQASPGVVAAGLSDPMLTAGAALLYDPQTGMILYEKNANEPRYPASTTKIMTALLTLEHVSDLEATVTAIEEDFAEVTPDSSNADIKVGETLRIIDLLYCLMLPSANEAAYILARYVGGTSQNFVAMMNARAAELGCTNTHFSNPCGLHAPDHYASARDLLRITLAAMEHPLFAQISNTAQKRLPATNMHKERIIYTTNQLIYSSTAPWYYVYCKGIKTGSTMAAGNCLVSYAERGNSNLYAVVLGCSSATAVGTVAASFTETKRLFEWGYSNFVSVELAREGDPVTELPIALSTDTDTLVLSVSKTVRTLLPATIKDPKNELQVIFDLPESCNAPVQAGQAIGKVHYVYDDVVYGSAELVALNTVTHSNVLYYASLLENFFSSTMIKLLTAFGLGTLGVWIAYHKIKSAILRYRHRRKMRERYMRRH